MRAPSRRHRLTILVFGSVFPSATVSPSCCGSALTEKIAATGAEPWCIGIKSGEATGWQFTDRLEGYVLRLSGPDVDDQWISHEVKFSDPQVADALKQVSD